MTVTIPESGQFAKRLESSHEGILLQVHVPTHEKVTLTLLDGSELVEAKSSTKAKELLKIQAGRVREEMDRDVLAPDVSLDDDEVAIANDFIAAFVDADAPALLKQLHEDAEIDEPVVSAYFDIIQSKLGEAELPQKTSWTKYDGDEAVIFKTKLGFKNGTADLRISVVDGKPIHFQFKSPKILADWLQKPKGSKSFYMLGEKVLRLCVAGDVESAYEMMSPIITEQISRTQLSTGLKNQLKNNLGETVTSVVADAERVESLKPVQGPVLRIFYLVEFANHQKVSAVVDFGFVGFQSEIVGVDFEPEAGIESFDERHFKSAQEFMTAFSSGDPANVIELTTKELQESAHPSVNAALMNAVNEKLGEFREIDEPNSSVHLTYFEGKRRLQFDGVVLFDRGKMRLKLADNFDGLDSIVLDGENFPDDFYRNIETSEFREGGKELLSRILNGNFDGSLPGVRWAWKSEVPKGELAKLIAARSENLGDLKKISFKDEEFFDTRRALTCGYDLEYEKSTIYGEVTFAFNVWSSEVVNCRINGGSRADTPAIALAASWEEATPESRLRPLFRAIASGEVDRLLGLMHANARRVGDRESLESIIKHVNDGGGPLAKTSWHGLTHARGDGNFAGELIEGTLNFETGAASVRVAFADNELTSFSIESGSFFVDTRPAIAVVDSYREASTLR